MGEVQPPDGGDPININTLERRVETQIVLRKIRRRLNHQPRPPTTPTSNSTHDSNEKNGSRSNMLSPSFGTNSIYGFNFFYGKYGGGSSFYSGRPTGRPALRADRNPETSNDSG